MYLCFGSNKCSFPRPGSSELINGRINLLVEKDTKYPSNMPPLNEEET